MSSESEARWMFWGTLTLIAGVILMIATLGLFIGAIWAHGDMCGRLVGTATLTLIVGGLSILGGAFMIDEMA